MTTDDTIRIGRVMPDYDIERELGRGGMGVVFLGRHKRLHRGAAIKELPPSFASEPEVRERFSTEAQTLATLAHPHIVPIFDYVERDGLCLIVMEELPGGSVWDRFTTSGLTPPTACAVVMACCAALQHAHNKGVLHLDVKPDNLMFDAESAVKVTDFGIARVISGDRTLGTVDGQVLGTPAYMSPEQARGEDLTAASDVYAAGVMLYELLSGQLPWQGAETASELLSQRLREDPIPLREVAPSVPPALAEVVMKSLSRDVEARYDRAEDFGIAIGEACAESWGPEWIDHSGVAIVGSERLSMAARTTGRHSGLVDAAAVEAPPSPAAPSTTTAGSGRASSTVTGAPTSVPGANKTGVVNRAGAAPAGAGETGVVGRTGTAPAGAGETSAQAATPQAKEAPATQVAAAAEPATAASSTTDEAITDEAGAPAVEADGAMTGDAAPPWTGEDMQFEVVRAAGAEPRIHGADLYDLELADLIGVEDVLDPPRRPWPALLITALLLGAAVLLALAGIDDPKREGTLTAGQVELAGTAVNADEQLELDLSADVPLRITDPALAVSVDAVDLEFSYFGFPVSTASAPVRAGDAIIDPGIAQRTVGGATTATVVLLAGTEVIAEQEIGVDATQTWYLTAPFVLGVLLLLLAYANLESSLKPLRSGHTRFLSYVGAFLSGVVGGLGLVLVSGALGFNEPTVPGAIVVAAVTATAGAAGARARLGIARRRRVRRAVKRAEKRLGVRAVHP